jgi:glycerophosphoryl diester phosphodiesterase
MQHHEYFSTESVVVLAHRGGLVKTENTLENFLAAAKVGVYSLETDVRTTLDNIAVLFHDRDLNRLAGLNLKISETNFSDLEKIDLFGGGTIISLEQALLALPQARFNLDIKDKKSTETVAAVIEKTKCHERVLVSSFSEKRRSKTLALLSKPVATSASAQIVLSLLFIHLLHLPHSFLDKRLKDIGALQIPRSMLGITLDSSSFIRKIRDSGTSVHFWTINDPEQMLELTARGANGIVTDVPELAVQTLRKA